MLEDISFATEDGYATFRQRSAFGGFHIQFLQSIDPQNKPPFPFPDRVEDKFHEDKLLKPAPYTAITAKMAVPQKHGQDAHATGKFKIKSVKCKIAERGAICYNGVMKAAELAKKIGAEVLISIACGLSEKYGQDTHAANEVEHVYAGDRVSDLLNHASGSTMLVSNLTSVQLIRIAELMEVAGVCLVNGHRPCEDDLRVMSEHGIAVLVSPVGLFETCGRIYQCLYEKKPEVQKPEC